MVGVAHVSLDGATSTRSQAVPASARTPSSGIAAILVRNGAAHMSFKVGDTVRLKSGSPVMTVVKVQPDDTSESNVACVWFSSDEEAHNGEFPGAALEMEEDETEEEEEEEEEEDEEEDDEDDEEDEDEEKGEKKGKGKRDK
jgi:uncharacterized protein YodC (DUF2158 family)